MSWLPTIDAAVNAAAKRVWLDFIRAGRCKTTTLDTFVREGHAMIDRARAAGSITFIPKNQTAPTYIEVFGARRAVPLAHEPDLYRRLGPADSDGFLLESWLIQALTEHFSQIVSILFFLGGPLFAMVHGEKETKS